jgi:tryptophan synthase beta chain
MCSKKTDINTPAECARKRIDLPQHDIPRNWYNILPDLPVPLPGYKEADTQKEIKYLPGPYSKTVSELEFSDKRWIEIPDEVVNSYVHYGRPFPLIRAHGLEKFLKTPAKIYYKCEDLPPAGSFKTNTALPQAYWAMIEGYERTVSLGTGKRTEFAFVSAAKTFGLVPTIFKTRSNYKENKDQVFFLKRMLNADLVESPSKRTETGRKFLKEDPNHPGSRAIGSIEVAEEAKQSEDAVAVTASFFNHTLLTQTIIGLEIEKQLNMIDEKPNVLIASVGAGSHFYGLIAPFLRDHLKKKLVDVKFLAVESETSSKLTDGKYEYFPLEGSMAGFLAKVYECSWETPPPTIIAWGIQTKNTAPLLSFLHKLGVIHTTVYPKNEKVVLDAASIFLQTEGRLLSPESAYSMKAVIDEAIDAKKSGEEKVIVVSVSATTYLEFGEKRKYTRLMD